MQKRLFFILFFGLVLIVPLVDAAVHLSWGDILNATNSKATMTFSMNVNADKVTVAPSKITLDNVTCANGAFIVQEVFSDANSNIDSREFCDILPKQRGGSSGGRGGSTSVFPPKVREMVKDVELFTFLKVTDEIEFLLKNELHSITIDSIGPFSVTLTVASKPKTFELKEGEIVNVDIDELGVDDIRIVVRCISNSVYVDLFVEKLVKTSIVDFILEEFTSEEQAEIFEESPEPDVLIEEEKSEVLAEQNQFNKQQRFKNMFFTIFLIFALILFIAVSGHHHEKR